MMEDLFVREIKKEELQVLDTFLHESKILDDKDRMHKLYIEDFGKKDGDYCIVTEFNKEIIGLCLVRYLNQYGIDKPSLIIYVKDDFRFEKIGSRLIYNMFLYLFNKDVVNVIITGKVDNNLMKFYRYIGFKIEFSRKDEVLLMIDLNKVFSEELLEYLEDLDFGFNPNDEISERNRKYRFTPSQMDNIIDILFDRHVLKEDGNLFEIDAPWEYEMKGRKTIKIDNELLRTYVEKRNKDNIQRIIDRANTLLHTDLTVIRYERLLEIRNNIVNKRLSKNSSSRLCDSPSGKKLSGKNIISKEQLTDDENNERIIARALEGMDYTNEVYKLIENYIRLYEVTDTNLKKNSGISRQVLNNIKLDKTKPSRKTIMQLCIGIGVDLEEGKLLMKAGGYVFNNQDFVERVIVSCLEDKIDSKKRIRSISRVNEILIEAGYEKEIFPNKLDYDPRKLDKKKK